MAPASLKPIPAGGKSLQATDVLEELARKLGPGIKLPTMRELCHQLRISRNTLEAALDRLEVQGLLYRKHGSGIYVSTLAQTRRIGLVIPRHLLMGGDASGNIYHLLAQELQDECRRRDNLLTNYIIDDAHDREKFGPEQLEIDIGNGRVDALITCGVTTEQANALQTLGVPCAFCTEDEEFFPRISMGWKTFVKDGVDVLVRKGCRRIGFAYPSLPDRTPHANRLEQFQQYVREAGIDDGFEWLMPFDVYNPSQRPLEASRLFHSMWASSTQRPEGLLSIDDQFTSGVLHAMEVLGVRCAEDLLVVSHANKGLELFGENPVIRMEFDSEERARVILATVDGLLSGRPVPREQIVSHRLRWPKAVEPVVQVTKAYSGRSL